MLSVRELSQTYKSFKALDRVSFDIPTGQVVGLLGPNGAGKTSLIRILTGSLPAVSGECFIDGLEIHDRASHAKAQIGYLPESLPLYGAMTVAEYLHFCAGLKAIPRQERKAACDGVLEKLSLGDRAHQLIDKLSKGLKQRTGLAMALLGKPRLLILDEPTSGLDPGQVIEFRKIIEAIKSQKQVTVFLSTHVMGEVEHLCDHFLILHHGRLRVSLSKAEVMSRGGLEKVYQEAVR
jgi:ABC-2 type transport system ATP-binding protein